MFNLPAPVRNLAHAAGVAGLLVAAGSDVSLANQSIGTALGRSLRPAPEPVNIIENDGYTWLQRMPLHDADRRELLGLPRKMKEVSGEMLNRLMIVTSAIVLRRPVSEVADDPESVARVHLDPRTGIDACRFYHLDPSVLGRPLQITTAVLGVKPVKKDLYYFPDVMTKADSVYYAEMPDSLEKAAE